VRSSGREQARRQLAPQASTAASTLPSTQDALRYVDVTSRQVQPPVPSCVPVRHMPAAGVENQRPPRSPTPNQFVEFRLQSFLTDALRQLATAVATSSFPAKRSTVRFPRALQPLHERSCLQALHASASAIILVSRSGKGLCALPCHSESSLEN